MSYRNPQIILDRSAEFMIQGFQKSSENFLSNFMKYRDKQREAEKAVQKQLQAKQLYSNKAFLERIKQYDETVAASGIKDKAFLEQFKEVAINQMTTGELFKYKGVDYNIGAIDAKTELALNPNLTSDQRAAYSMIVSNSEQFQKQTLEAAGAVIAGLKPLEDQSPYTIGTNFDFAGTGKEEFQNMVASNALLNRQAQGVKVNKKFSRVANDNGTYDNMMSISASFDTNSDLWKRMKNMYPELEDSDATFEWKRNVDKFAEGGSLLTNLGEFDMGTNEALRASQYIDENNNPTKKGLIEQTVTRKPTKRGLKTYQVEETHFDPDMLWNDRVYNDTINAKIDGFMTMPQDQIWKYMQYNLPLPDSSSAAKERFFNADPAKQKAYLSDLIKQKDVSRLYGADYKSRIVTQEDVDFYRKNGIEIDLQTESGLPTAIYYKEKATDITSQIEKQVKDTKEKQAVDISYIEDLKIPIQEGPAEESGKRYVDLDELENSLNAKGFVVKKAEQVGPRGVNKITITKSVSGADNQATINEEMTPQEIKDLLELVETGKMPAKKGDNTNVDSTQYKGIYL